MSEEDKSAMPDKVQKDAADADIVDEAVEAPVGKEAVLDAAQAIASKEIENKGAPIGDGKHGKKKHKKANRKHLAIAAIVIIAIVAVGGGVMLKWHEQPSFCSTFCHIENTYVANYSQEQGVVGTDKYGNTVSNTNAML